MRKSIAIIISTLMGGCLLIYTGSRTVDLIQLTLKGDQSILGFLALAALDGGLIGWTLLFLYGSSGIWQRGICALMVIVSLIGITIAFVADTFVQAGARGTIAKADPAMIAGAIWVTAIIIGANITALTFFHLTDPDRRKIAAEKEAQGLVEDEVIRQISRSAPQLGARVAPIVAEDWVRRLEAQMYSGISSSPPPVPPILPSAPPPIQYQYQIPMPTSNGNSGNDSAQSLPAARGISFGGNNSANEPPEGQAPDPNRASRNS